MSGKDDGRGTSAGDRYVDRLITVAELALVPMCIAIGIRLLKLDSTESTILVVTFLPMLLFPAWLLLGIGIGARRRRLVIAAALVLAFQVRWVASDTAWHHDGVSAAASTAPTIDVLSANVFERNTDPTPLFDQILEADPDVVALVEMTPANLALYQAHPVSGAYPYVWWPPKQPEAVLLSRLPFAEAGVLSATRKLPWVAVDVGGRRITVLAVHTINATKSAHAWEQDLAAIDTWADALDGPLVMAGDFNATMQHRQFRALFDAETTDAHLARGQGWGATWNARWFLGPVLRIDHILVRGDLEVVRFWRGGENGSDHLPIAARIAVLRQ